MNATGYFHHVAAQTPTRVWVNNPTIEESQRAIELGAVGATTNPAGASKILPKLSDDRQQQIVQEVLAAASDTDDAVDRVQMQLVSDLLPLFAPQHTPGKPDGHVSIQGNPFFDTDADHILHECSRYDELGPNVIHKIPATKAGIEVMADLLRRGKSVLATEMMSVAQTRAVCAMYDQVLPRAEGTPCLITTHITGIYDEYLEGHAQELGADLSTGDLHEAGFIVARKVRKVLDDSGLPVHLMGGGARRLRHFTDMVGGDIHITTNPGDIFELAETNPPVEQTFLQPIDEAQRARLAAALPDFRRAWDDDGLAPEEFESFGPVLHFLASFKKGWVALRERLEQEAPVQG